MEQGTRKETSRQRIVDAARKLFTDKGFHSSPVSELAAEASVSVGLIYRLFPGKDDIIVAIAEESCRTAVAVMEEIFGSVERGEYSVFDAVKALAHQSIVNDDGSLKFEILAEANRNPRVADGLKMLVVPYRDGIRRLATLARPNTVACELDAYVDIMMACFFGLGHRTLIDTGVDVEQASHEAACLLMRALGAPHAGTADAIEEGPILCGDSDSLRA